MKVLFLDDCNMFEGHNPIATLVQVSNTNEEQIKTIEKQQLGVYRMGGRWLDIMKTGNIPYEVLKKGRMSDFKKEDYDIEYRLISGNY